MPALKTLMFWGRHYYLYEKSIKVEGVEPHVYYGRSVTDEDAEQLSELMRVGFYEGCSHVRNSIKHALHIKE